MGPHSRTGKFPTPRPRHGHQTLNGGIRRRRKALGLTQAEVAMRAGVALRSVHEVETGAAWPSTRTVGSVASVLGAGLGIFRRKARP